MRLGSRHPNHSVSNSLHSSDVDDGEFYTHAVPRRGGPIDDDGGDDDEMTMLMMMMMVAHLGASGAMGHMNPIRYCPRGRCTMCPALTLV